MSGLEEWPSCRFAGRQNSAYRPGCQVIDTFGSVGELATWTKRKVMGKLLSARKRECRRHDGKVAQDGGARRAVLWRAEHRNPGYSRKTDRVP